MDAGFVKFLSEFGIAGIMGLFLYLSMQQSFKQQDKLIEKIDKLIDSINKLAVEDTEKYKTVEQYIIETRAIHLSNKTKIENIAEKVEGIDIRTKFCPNINELLREKNR